MSVEGPTVTVPTLQFSSTTVKWIPVSGGFGPGRPLASLVEPGPYTSNLKQRPGTVCRLPLDTQ